MNEEPTIGHALKAALGPYYGIYGMTDEDVAEAAEALGVNPEMTVGRLREDLEIAARVRACSCENDVDRPYMVTTAEGWMYNYPDTLLAFLRGETP